MIHTVAKAIAILGTAFAVSGMGYFLACLWSARVYLADRRSPGLACDREGGSKLPSVSILKPLKGVDPEIYESFRSHCLLDYPDYEIIFGVSEADDPAVQTVRRLQQEFPQRTIQLIVCSQNLGANRKVSNLIQMLEVARHDRLIVDDSDIRVQTDYLRHVVAPLADPAVGMVTCLYRGMPGPTLGSRLESLGISTDFAAGVLVARSLEGGVRFGLGSTLAFRRVDLQAIGGFESLVDHLADDYELGRRIAALGRRVVLSEVVVDTFLPPYDFKGFFQHQLRWGRAIRDSRPWGYFGLLLTFGLPWALLTVIASRGAYWAWGLLGATLVLRLAVVLVVGRGVLGDQQVLRLLPLLPLRDGIAALVWIASLVSNTISWRGDSFVLKDGKLIRTGTPS
jgi:ceramide glucosyltransferase